MGRRSARNFTHSRVPIVENNNQHNPLDAPVTSVKIVVYDLAGDTTVNNELCCCVRLTILSRVLSALVILGFCHSWACSDSPVKSHPCLLYIFKADGSSLWIELMMDWEPCRPYA